MDSCGKHSYEMGVALCRRCGGSWCGSCVVYSFGPKKPPYCVSCAMVAGGVRTSAAFPAMSRKMLKAQMKAVKAEAKAAGNEPESTPELEQELADAYGKIDWTTPWWEDQSARAS